MWSTTALARHGDLISKTCMPLLLSQSHPLSMQLVEAARCLQWGFLVFWCLDVSCSLEIPRGFRLRAHLRLETMVIGDSQRF